MLHIVTYHWGTKYAGYVDKLIDGVRRNLKEPHEFVVINDDYRLPSLETPDAQWPIPAEDNYLLEIPGCLARLRLFDFSYVADFGVKFGDRIVCLDLDLIITGSLDGLFDRDETFTILQGVNTSNPNPYNGSVWMLRAGEHADVWNDFTLAAVKQVPYYAFPDDQAWMHHKIPQAGMFGPVNGVYAFGKNGWPEGDRLPENARIVAFPGHRDPSQFTHLDWVKENWRA